ncbi:MAG: ATP-binding protein [Halofilum sp. (in: g-proteobacteria)]|nr:ATP-binding protein [Halofilum sp. (in: g-proteobacteria)]
MRRPDSLQGRLTLAMTLVLAAFLALAGLALDRAHKRSVEAGVHRGLEARVYLLLGAAELEPGGGVEMPEALAEPRLGTPDSGLYAAIRGAGGALLWQSDSSLGRDVPYPAAGPPGRPARARVEGAGGEALYALAYPVTWELPGGGTRQLDFLVAESAAAAEQRIAAFRRTLQAWFAGIAAVLLATQAAVLAWGLRPLRRAAREVGEIRTGARERLGGGYPRELRPLTQNLNALLDGSRMRLQRYRDALSDLAHSLKTPLAVLRAGDAEPTVREQAERMERAIGWHVQRAATAGRTGLAQTVSVAGVVERMTAALRKVHAGREVQLECRIEEGVRFQGDPEDLMEIVGNLLDNAWKWCRGRIRCVAANIDGGSLLLEVEDDGPGIPRERRRQVLARGVRADESVPGEGIGLHLVRQMVEDAYAGTIELDESDLGGLRVQIRLPATEDAGSA